MNSFQCGGAVEDCMVALVYGLIYATLVDSFKRWTFMTTYKLSWHQWAFFFGLSDIEAQKVKEASTADFELPKPPGKAVLPQRQELWYNTDLKWSDTVLALQRHRHLFTDYGRATSVKVNNSSSI